MNILPVVPDDAMMSAAGAPSAQSMSGPRMDALTERFENMMSDKSAAPPEPGAFSDMLDRQQSAMEQEHAGIASLSDMSGLTQVEQAMRTMQVGQLASANSFKVQAGVAIGSNANKSLQSLLKNS